MNGDDSKRAAWIGYLKEWEASGETRGGFCAARGLSIHAFDYWRQRLGGAPSRKGFVRVVTTPVVNEAAQSIEIRLPSGVSLLWKGTAVESLVALLRALSLA